MVGLLTAYRFPGNVRELESMIFNAVSCHQGGTLTGDAVAAHIAHEQCAVRSIAEPDSTTADASSITFSHTLPTIKVATHLLVQEALRRSGGNQSRAAAMLGISQQALSKRLRKAKQGNH